MLFTATCITEYDQMSGEDKGNYIRDKLRNSMTSIFYTLNIVIKVVCRETFMRVYDYKHDTIERLCREIKDGVNATSTNFSDSTAS